MQKCSYSGYWSIIIINLKHVQLPSANLKCLLKQLSPETNNFKKYSGNYKSVRRIYFVARHQMNYRINGDKYHLGESTLGREYDFDPWKHIITFTSIKLALVLCDDTILYGNYCNFVCHLDASGKAICLVVRVFSIPTGYWYCVVARCTCHISKPLAFQRQSNPCTIHLHRIWLTCMNDDISASSHKQALLVFRRSLNCFANNEITSLNRVMLNFQLCFGMVLLL